MNRKLPNFRFYLQIISLFTLLVLGKYLKDDNTALASEIGNKNKSDIVQENDKAESSPANTVSL